MGFTTLSWQKERWSRRAADTLTSYGRCWNPSLGNWDGNWRFGDQDCVRTAMKNHIGNDKRADGQKIAIGSENKERLLRIALSRRDCPCVGVERHANRQPRLGSRTTLMACSRTNATI